MLPLTFARHDRLQPQRLTASSDHVVSRSHQTPQSGKTKRDHYERICSKYRESFAIKNDEFRRVLFTAKYCQLVVMALKPREEIGAEVHKLDQFFRVEEGSGEAVLDGVQTAIREASQSLSQLGRITTSSIPEVFQ